ncbi:hypothetical protein EZJ43_07875 [Pedobacter changchengzhani]|uniref:Uncharacterized protein n=1 Tax=Pedobacter changchengzhani TaxID=2529274 RepID=A0A4R5MLC2_9SPHI|nr:hypothetical protein [Pedobacter changchengzhani]TDG36428.1 hypothetical protein EZJ43_07875 [Pedobacter changchengzhani]
MRYLPILIAVLFFTSCSKGQIKEEVGLTNKLVYNKKNSNYTVHLSNSYQAEIFINGFPIHPVLPWVGATVLDLGIEKVGTQKLKIILDLNAVTLENFAPKPEDQILSINLKKGFDDDNAITFRLLYSDLKDGDFKKGYYVKEIEFEAKPAYHFFKEEAYVDLRKQPDLLDSLYARYQSILYAVNDKNAKAFVKKIEVAEYQSAQLRNMEKEWVFKERERFFKNKLNLPPIDSCKLVFTDNGKMATLGLKYDISTGKKNAMINFPALSGIWEKGSVPKFIDYYHYFFFAKQKDKNELQLLRWRTFTYDMDM